MYEFDFSKPLEIRTDLDNDFWLVQPSTNAACMLDACGASSFREKEREYSLSAPAAVLLDVLPYDEVPAVAATGDLVQNVSEAIHAAKFKIAQEPLVGVLLRDRASGYSYVRLAIEGAHWMRVDSTPSYHSWDDIKDGSLERVHPTQGCQH